VRVSAAGPLPVSIDRAWAGMMEWERQPEWMLDASAVRVVGDRREGVGTRFAVRTRVLGIPAFTEVLEVTRWEPPHALDVRHTGFVRGAGRWRLSEAAGGTTFAWEEELRMPIPVLGELALLAYRPFMRMLMRRAIGRLGERL
jgi:hypothetical protein